ncbi:MAG: hypothetical protein NXI10_07810 [bacterium]|nr:hypothetical protein [bacterium]
MNKMVLLFALLVTQTSWSQSEEYTWESIHQKHLKWIENQGMRYEYKALLRNEYKTEGYIRRRLYYAWHLGKMDDLYTYLPQLFTHLEGKSREQKNRILNKTINLEEAPMTEWRRYSGMLKALLNRFENHPQIQEHLTPGLLFTQHMTGQFSLARLGAEKYLETCTDSIYKERVRELYLRVLHELEEFKEAKTISMDLYKETGNPDYLQSYCNAVKSLDDPVAYLLLEDTIKNNGFYFQYFNMLYLHIERGETDAIEYYLDWFEDSLTIDKWSQGYELEGEDITYVFASYHIKMIADYYREADPEKACELYKQILKGEEMTYALDWQRQKDAEFYLAKVGTESEEAFMELWEQNKKYRQELIEACEFEVGICE